MRNNANVVLDGAIVTRNNANVVLDGADVTRNNANVALNGADVTRNNANVALDGGGVMHNLDILALLYDRIHLLIKKFQFLLIHKQKIKNYHYLCAIKK